MSVGLKRLGFALAAFQSEPCMPCDIRCAHAQQENKWIRYSVDGKGKRNNFDPVLC